MKTQKFFFDGIKNVYAKKVKIRAVKSFTIKICSFGGKI